MHLQGLYCFQGCTAPLWVLPSGFRKLVGLRFSKDAMHLQGLYRLQGCSAPILVLTSCRLQKRTALKAMLRRSTRFWFLPSGLRKLVEASLLERCNAPSGLYCFESLLPQLRSWFCLQGSASSSSFASRKMQCTFRAYTAFRAVLLRFGFCLRGLYCFESLLPRSAFGFCTSKLKMSVLLRFVK